MLKLKVNGINAKFLVTFINLSLLKVTEFIVNALKSKGYQLKGENNQILHMTLMKSLQSKKVINNKPFLF